MGVIRDRRQRLLKHRARKFRAAPTDAERHLWQILRGRQFDGWKWRRQVPIGAYVVDFLCIEAALVVELDGPQHAERAAYDRQRDACLRRMGFRVLRFGNDELLDNPSAVVERVLVVCDRGREAAPRWAVSAAGPRAGVRR